MTRSAAASSCSSSAAASRCPPSCRWTTWTRSRRRATWSSAMRSCNTLSYQQARHFNVPMRGVFVATPGYMLRRRRRSARRGDHGRWTPSRSTTLADVRSAHCQLGDGARAAVRFFTIDDPNSSQLRSIRMDRRWFPARHCQRDDRARPVALQGTASGPAPKPDKPAPRRIRELQRSRSLPKHGAVAGAVSFRHAVLGLRRHRAQLPRHRADHRCRARPGRHRSQHRAGVARRCAADVCRYAGDPGRVVYIHPLHNLAVVAYDPKLIGSTPVRAAKLAVRDLKAGETVSVVGLARRRRARARAPPHRRRRSAGSCRCRAHALSRQQPRGRAAGQSAGRISSACLANDDRQVRGLWSSFAFDNGRELVQENRGMSSDLVAEMLELVRHDRPLHSLEAEFACSRSGERARVGLDGGLGDEACEAHGASRGRC